MGLVRQARKSLNMGTVRQESHTICKDQRQKQIANFPTLDCQLGRRKRYSIPARMPPPTEEMFALVPLKIGKWFKKKLDGVVEKNVTINYFQWIPLN